MGLAVTRALTAVLALVRPPASLYVFCQKKAEKFSHSSRSTMAIVDRKQLARLED